MGKVKREEGKFLLFASPFLVLCDKANTAKHHAQSVQVKMALTEDLTQKQQHTFTECTLYAAKSTNNVLWNCVHCLPWK